MSVATVPGTPWQNGMFMETCKVPGAASGVTTVLLRALPERFHWIGRAGCVFFRKSFVARSLRAFHRPAPRSRLVLRKNPRRHPFPPN